MWWSYSHYFLIYTECDEVIAIMSNLYRMWWSYSYYFILFHYERVDTKIPVITERDTKAMDSCRYKCADARESNTCVCNRCSLVLGYPHLKNYIVNTFIKCTFDIHWTICYFSRRSSYLCLGGSSARRRLRDIFSNLLVFRCVDFHMFVYLTSQYLNN